MGLTIASADRVRANTRPELNRKLDLELERRLKFFATQDKAAITERLEELDREWDIERVLETNAASIGLFGGIMTVLSGRKWVLLPLVVSGLLLQHAISGWCPPLSLFRKMGVRTRIEIEQERAALKLLRGDFDHLERTPGTPMANTNQLAAMVRT